MIKYVIIDVIFVENKKFGFFWKCSKEKDEYELVDGGQSRLGRQFQTELHHSESIQEIQRKFIAVLKAIGKWHGPNGETYRQQNEPKEKQYAQTYKVYKSKGYDCVSMVWICGCVNSEFEAKKFLLCV